MESRTRKEMTPDQRSPTGVYRLEYRSVDKMVIPRVWRQSIQDDATFNDIMATVVTNPENYRDHIVYRIVPVYETKDKV